MDHLTMQENIAACDARIAASKVLMKALAERAEAWMAQFETTRGAAIEPKPHTEPKAPRWPLCIATDGERANGRLAWVPGL